MNIEHIKKIKILFYNIKYHHSMYFPEGLDYNVVTSYILGFLTAESFYDTEEILKGFVDWLKTKDIYRSGIYWKYLLWEDSDRDNDKAVEMLFNYLQEYLEFLIDKHEGNSKTR